MDLPGSAIGCFVNFCTLLIWALRSDRTVER